jgi:hypothetical protein
MHLWEWFADIDLMDTNLRFPMSMDDLGSKGILFCHCLIIHHGMLQHSALGIFQGDTVSRMFQVECGLGRLSRFTAQGLTNLV